MCFKQHEKINKKKTGKGQNEIQKADVLKSIGYRSSNHMVQESGGVLMTQSLRFMQFSKSDIKF